MKTSEAAPEIHKHQYMMQSVLRYAGKSYITYACECGKLRGKVSDIITKSTERGK